VRICFVYDSEYPWDVRVEKMCRTLHSHGHQVFLVCRNRQARPLRSPFSYGTICRMPHVGTSTLTHLINATLFFNPFWIGRIAQIVVQHRCHVVIVRDLPLALAAIGSAKIAGRPCIVDMAEPYPLTVLQRRQLDPPRWHSALTRSYSLALAVERLVVRCAAHIFTVCEEASDRLIVAGAQPHQITLVRNTPNLNDFQNTSPSFPGIMKRLKGSFIALYAGMIFGSRGIDTALLAMKKCAEVTSNIRLVIVGTGTLETQMRNLAYRLGLLNNSVFFEGWVDHENITDYIASCDVGLLPFHDTRHINTTIANKLFDFMALDKPVICSNVSPMRRIIAETSAGVLFEPGNPDDLAAKILEVRSSPLNGAGRGLEAVFRKYNWGHDESRLLEALGTLVQGHTHAGRPR